MDIGRLNKRVTFCRYSEEENELKQLRQQLKPIKTVWATVEPKSGREYIEADKERPELTYIITVRYQKDITPDMFFFTLYLFFFFFSTHNLPFLFFYLAFLVYFLRTRYF